MKVKKLVIDTSALIQNVPLQNFTDEVYTIQEVVTEVRDKATRNRLRTVPYKFIFREPSAECYTLVKNASIKCGDYNNLSVVDLKVLALAVQMAKEAGMTVREDLDEVKEAKVITGAEEGEKSNVVMPGWGEAEEAESEDDEVDANGDDGDVSEDEELVLTELINDFQKLDQHLSDKSYIEGTESSLADYAVFINIKSEIDAKFKNATKWYSQMESFKSDFQAQLEEKKLEAAAASGEYWNDENALEKDSGEENLENVEENDVESEEEEEDNNDDDDGWITPANIKAAKKQGGAVGNSCYDDPEDTELAAACATGDFSMQNVLLKLGIPVISRDGMRVSQVRSWALRCATCGTTSHDMSIIFCKSCGHRNLKRVPFTVDAETGEKKYFLSKNKQLKCLNLRGTIFDTKKPKGGKHCTDVILSDGVKINYDRLSRKAMRRQNMAAGQGLDDADNPFMMHDVSSRGFHLGNFRSKKYAIAGNEMTAQQLRMGAHLGNNKKSNKGKNRR